MEKAHQRRIDQGLCMQCGAPRGADGGNFRCALCIAKQTASKRAKEKVNTSKGLCKTCSKPIGEDGTKIYCRSCANKVREKANILRKKMRADRLAAGLCKECGAPQDNTTQVCNVCREKKNIASRKYKAKLPSKKPAIVIKAKKVVKQKTSKKVKVHDPEACVDCGGVRDNETKRCNSCRAHHKEVNDRFRANARAYREEHNLCTSCGKNPKIPGKSSCEICMVKSQSRDATGTKTNWEFFLNMLERQEHKCYYTGERIDVGRNASLDHIIPRTHKNFPGYDDFSNICWCTMDINRMKMTKTLEEFRLVCPSWGIKLVI